MVLLACVRFQENNRQSCSSALESEIPYIVAQAFAALFESRGIAFARTWDELSVRRQVVQTRACAQDFQYRVRIRLPVGGKAQGAANPQPVGDQLNERRLHQPALMVAFLRPRVRKQDERPRPGSAVSPGVVKTSTASWQITRTLGHLPLLESQQQVADAGPMHFHTQVVAFGVSRGKGFEVVAVAEADLERDGGAPTEDCI